MAIFFQRQTQAGQAPGDTEVVCECWRLISIWRPSLSFSSLHLALKVSVTPGMTCLTGDGEDLRGWLIGQVVGGDEVSTHCQKVPGSSMPASPPEHGWISTPRNIEEGLCVTFAHSSNKRKAMSLAIDHTISWDPTQSVACASSTDSATPGWQ
jgi:hypothetical protein